MTLSEDGSALVAIKVTLIYTRPILTAIPIRLTRPSTVKERVRRLFFSKWH